MSRSPNQDHAALMRAVRTAIRLGRIEDYEFLRRQGETREAAARRLGVSVRTVQRYESTLRERQAA